MQLSKMKDQQVKIIINDFVLELIANEKKVLMLTDLAIIKEMRSLTSNLYFFRIPLSNKESTLALTLKITRPEYFHLGENEVFFYENIATKSIGDYLPRCWLTDTNKLSKLNYIVLDDYSTYYATLDNDQSFNGGHLRDTIKILAKFHCQWWGNKNLITQPQMLDAAKIHPDILRSRQAFSQFVDLLGTKLSNKHRKIFESIFANWPPKKITQRFVDKNHITIVHGDFFSGNIMHPVDELSSTALKIIDWQYWHFNVGVYDLANLIAKNWTPMQRALYEKDTLKKYYHYLIETEISGYSWEDCWEDYRMSVIPNTLKLILMYHEHPQRGYIWDSIFENVMSAFEDLRCCDFL